MPQLCFTSCNSEISQNAFCQLAEYIFIFLFFEEEEGRNNILYHQSSFGEEEEANKIFMTLLEFADTYSSLVYVANNNVFLSRNKNHPLLVGENDNVILGTS